MKYISVEKLKAEIKGLQCEQGFEDGETERGYQVAIKDILRIITSLQQEQPEKTLTFDGFVDKVGTWFAQLRLDKFRKTFNGEIFPATQLVQEYDLFVRELSKTYSDKQEQPEVDLEKEMNKLISLEYVNQPYDEWEMCIARHFYELGLNTREEENK